MLNNIYEFQKIHLNTQRIMYFLPLVFIYFFLLPNHYQLLVNADESILIKIFDSAQEFLILIEIWFQYLGFRWILSPELKEISYCNMRIKKNMWFSSNTILSVVLFLPYAIILALISEKYFFNVPVIFFQCVLAGIMTFFLMHLLKSALRRYDSNDYIYDAEELSFDEKIDITNYGGTHYKAILFDNNILFSNSVDSGDHPCNTVCIYSINDKTIETISFDQYYPLDLAVWDNILIVSHFDLVKREGGGISIYNLETKELNNIELGHDAEQMTINENVIYILSDKIIYQYELKDMNLYLKCKTQIKKSNEENYLSGIFYIKPESVKFTL